MYYIILATIIFCVSSKHAVRYRATLYTTAEYANIIIAHVIKVFGCIENIASAKIVHYHGEDLDNNIKHQLDILN